MAVSHDHRLHAWVITQHTSFEISNKMSGMKKVKHSSYRVYFISSHSPFLHLVCLEANKHARAKYISKKAPEEL